MRHDPRQKQTFRSMSHRLLKYGLMTAARNEEAFVENTIRSVVAQTALPARWIIVSDGSTDRTDSIVQKYAAQYDWIQLLRMPEHREHQFAAKVHCLRAAWEKLQPAELAVEICTVEHSRMLTTLPGV